MKGRFDIKGEEHAAKVIDEFLAVEKTLVGTAGWVCDIDTEECRIGWLLAVDGVPTEARLDVCAYPMDSDHGFSIVLNFPSCISRLDFVGPNEGHTNPLERDGERSQAIVYGPHLHTWKNNRQLCGASSLPKELTFAVPLSPTIKRYEQAMFHFCDEVNISMTSSDLLPLPPKGRLL